MTARKKAPPDDAALKASVLKAALPHVPFDGFSDKLLDRAGEQTGIDKQTMTRLFPKGALDFVEEFSVSADRQMEAEIAKLDLPNLRIRDRIRSAVKIRLDVLRPNKEAARRAAAFLTLPPNAVLGAKLLWRTVDIMWRATGDTTTDFNYYTKRAILAGVYSSTLMRWFNDNSDDEAATDAFLDKRIEDVMNFEKFKARVKKDVGGKFPSLEEILNRVNRRPSP
ncbi:MAG TPA: COQ9 family protein [Rhizomicrobium sp.]|nr:COQ9 family protein [Rhizomicrobium sp.]